LIHVSTKSNSKNQHKKKKSNLPQSQGGKKWEQTFSVSGEIKYTFVYPFVFVSLRCEHLQYFTVFRWIESGDKYWNKI